jgi:hypothetical protein
LLAYRGREPRNIQKLQLSHATPAPQVENAAAIRSNVYDHKDEKE